MDLIFILAVLGLYAVSHALVVAFARLASSG
jgi:hypothetical protein